MDYLPTFTVDDGDEELLRCRGHPTEEAIERIVGLCGQGSPGREAPPARPRRDEDKGTVTKAEPQGRDLRGQGVRLMAGQEGQQVQASGDGAQQQDQAGAQQGANQQGANQQQARYTDADVDAIISKKFAKWQEQHEAKVAEAAKLAEMNATQRAEYERDQLQRRLDELRRKGEAPFLAHGDDTRRPSTQRLSLS